jgi:hypothetical protein
MTFLVLVIQGALFGYAAGIAFADNVWLFVISIFANPLCTILYHEIKNKE